MDNEHRELKYPAIYKHFKNKYYATMGISVPINRSIERAVDTTLVNVQREDNSALMVLVRDKEGNFYHYKDEEENCLVVYVSLYDEHIPYVRVKEIFLSEVEHDKHPNVIQKYRFELVKYD